MIPPTTKFNSEDERCTDILDISGKTTELLRAESERRARLNAAPQKDVRFDGEHCVEPDCGVDLPQARLDLGRIRCVDCQTSIELRNKQRG